MVVKGNYKIAERIFLVFSAALLMYVISALMGKPHWEEIGGAIIHPKVKMNEQSIEMIIGSHRYYYRPLDAVLHAIECHRKGVKDKAVQIHSS